MSRRIQIRTFSAMLLGFAIGKLYGNYRWNKYFVEPLNEYLEIHL